MTVDTTSVVSVIAAYVAGFISPLLSAVVDYVKSKLSK